MSMREDQSTESLPIQQQIGILNLRINDLMSQLNIVMKTLLQENSILKEENAKLNTKQEKTSKS